MIHPILPKGIYPKEMETYIHANIYMFIALISIIAQKWKKSKCQLTGE